MIKELILEQIPVSTKKSDKEKLEELEKKLDFIIVEVTKKKRKRKAS